VRVAVAPEADARSTVKGVDGGRKSGWSIQD
jgi:hypothetical protein